MKRPTSTRVLLPLGLAILAAIAIGIPPVVTAEESDGLVTVQARILQDGAPVNANLDLRFEIYDAATAGTRLWFEDQTGVEVRNGILSAQLGDVTPLGGIFGDDVDPGVSTKDRYVAILLGGSEIVPRVQLTAVPYTLHAGVATVTSTIYNPSGADLDLAGLDGRYVDDAAELAGAGLEDDGSAGLGRLRIAAAAAGNGLTGGAGSALAVGDANKGVQVNGADLQVDASEIAGDGLEQTTGAGNEHLLAVDGDHVDIDWNPSNYTPSAAPTEAADVDDLTAHLQGIDTALGSGGGTGTTLPHVAGGRISLASTSSVTTSDTTSDTLYYVRHPGAGNHLALYDGTSSWSYVNIPVSPVSATSTSLTAANNYDVFAYDSSGLTLELVAWTSDTVRATDLVVQDGVYLKTGALTRRYLGTIRTISSTGTKFTETESARLVWNAHNQVTRADFTDETINSWTNAGNGTWSAINLSGGASAFRREFVFGTVGASVTATQSLVHGYAYSHAIALDSTSVVDRNTTSFGVHVIGHLNDQSAAHYAGAPGIGYHYLQGVETTYHSSVTITAYGAHNAPTIGSGWVAMQSGLRTVLQN
ncbi:hypothetical protein OAX78_02845 [Planctomycetota bacterium]|nr:hypothetical protein [Planctomycetota bacterium]